MLDFIVYLCYFDKSAATDLCNIPCEASHVREYDAGIDLPLCGVSDTRPGHYHPGNLGWKYFPMGYVNQLLRHCYLLLGAPAAQSKVGVPSKGRVRFQSYGHMLPN